MAVEETTVFIPFAYVEAAANILTNPQLDPIGKIPEYKYCAVRVGPAREEPQRVPKPSLEVTASGL
jgi:formate dehydrogenase major subunit